MRELEAELAGEMLEAIKNGAVIEPGEMRVKIVARQRGSRKIQRLVVY